MTETRSGVTSGPDLGAALASAFEQERRTMADPAGAEAPPQRVATPPPEPTSPSSPRATGGADLELIRDELAAQREMLTSIEHRLGSPDVLLVEDPVVGALSQRLRGAEDELRRLADAAQALQTLLAGIGDAVDALRHSGRGGTAES